MSLCHQTRRAGGQNIQNIQHAITPHNERYMLPSKPNRPFKQERRFPKTWKPQWWLPGQVNDIVKSLANTEKESLEYPIIKFSNGTQIWRKKKPNPKSGVWTRGQPYSLHPTCVCFFSDDQNRGYILIEFIEGKIISPLRGRQRYTTGCEHA